MGENTKIEWAHHTFNPWIGCTKVSPACDHCYAEQVAKRMQVSWGSGELRKRTSAANWKEPRKWDRKAQREGVRYRVFCASLADVFDNEVPSDWREDLWQLIRETPNLDWLLLTKRVGNIWNMLPEDWGEGWSNVWLGITVVTQAEADRDIPKLLDIPARIRFLSCEPLLEGMRIEHLLERVETCPTCDGSMSVPVEGGGAACPDCIDDWAGQGNHTTSRIHWVIAGGESGTDARPMNPAWVRSLKRQCQYEVPFFFKQFGEWAPRPFPAWPENADYMEQVGKGCWFPETREWMERVGKKNAGRTIDGETWDQVPEVQR